MPLKPFDTPSMKLRSFLEITFQAPEDDIDRVLQEIAKHTDLVHGKTDRNAYRTVSGFEYYRPLEGTPTGAESEVRQRPGVAQTSVLIAHDPAVLEGVIEAIYAVHSYYEPVIIVREILRSETKGLDDSDNQHRWWNTTGDWKDHKAITP